MRNSGLEEAQAEINIARGNINNLIYADNTTLMAESEEDEIELILLGSSNGKEPTCNARNLSSILGLGRSPEKNIVTHSSILA